MERINPPHKRHLKNRVNRNEEVPDCPKCGHGKSKFTRLTGKRRCNNCFNLFDSMKEWTPKPTKIEIAVKELKGTEVLHMEDGRLWRATATGEMIKDYGVAD